MQLLHLRQRSSTSDKSRDQALFQKVEMKSLHASLQRSGENTFEALLYYCSMLAFLGDSGDVFSDQKHRLSSWLILALVFPLSAKS